MTEQDTPIILNENIQESYRKFKAFMMEIYFQVKCRGINNEMKRDFYNSYLDFACQLDSEGFKDESYDFMAVCAMYYDLMDRSEDLINHESFFKDLFKAFGNLLTAKTDPHTDYESQYDEFIMYSSKIQQYYYTQVAIPSEYYDKDTLKEITASLI